MRVHFLNVKEGACSVIEHDSGRITVIDICNGNVPITESGKKEASAEGLSAKQFSDESNPLGNFHQKEHPVCPLNYISKNIPKSQEGIFRFILTHPDMDHMDGLEAFFNKFKVYNFWDTPNNKKLDSVGGGYKQSDWDFYQQIHYPKKVDGYTILNVEPGAENVYWNKGDKEGDVGDGIYVLSPSRAMCSQANEDGEYNDLSYVLLVMTPNGRRIVFAGDSEESSWNVILDNEANKKLLTNIDVLIAPHHGRKTGGSEDFLDTLKPKLTLFGNAQSKDLDYPRWGDDYLHFTNNQINCAVLEDGPKQLDLYITYEKFAIAWRRKNYGESCKMFKHPLLDAWLLKSL